MRIVQDLFPRALLGLAVAFSAACASGGAANTAEPAATPTTTTPAAEGALTLRVINSHSSGDDVTVFLQPETGAQKQIGNVANTGTLNVPFTETRGRYRFVAERPNGARITSPYFNAQLAGVYVWDIALNRVDRKDR